MLRGVIPDEETCVRACTSRDGRFDGWFVLAVRSTGIYCRPSCPAPVSPKRANMRFFATSAAAQRAGFRACKRCRPDASPGSPEWNVRADLVGRAMRLIADGVVDRDGVPGLARRLAVSERHLNRLLVAEVGASPLALARAQRAQTARLLIETTDLSFAHVAFGAGFASIRQFNDTIREVFATTPTALRTTHRRGPAAGGALTVRLPVRRPFAADALLAFLADRAVPGVERVHDGVYRRTLRLAGGPAVVTLTPTDDHVLLSVRLAALADLQSAVRRCRQLLDLDADPVSVDATLAGDPLLAPLVAARPGLRSPGAVDGAELAVRAVLGQQVSVAGARTIAGRLALSLGEPIEDETGELTRLFPTAAALADASDDLLPMPVARRRALRALCTALADGALVLDAGADRDTTRHALLVLPGIGPWTADYIAMRALSDPDAFLPTDLGVRHALAALGATSDPTALAERWRPWRAYATHHLWNSLGGST